MNGAQVRMARAALKLSVRELAVAARVSPNTITRVEADQPCNPSTMAVIQRALESAGVIFLSENGEGAGVRLRKHVAPEDLTRKIEAVEEHLATTKIEGKPSPARGVQQMQRAHTKNELVKLKNKRAKGKTGLPK